MLTTFKATAKALPEGLQVETNSRGFKIHFDEPEDLGGTDTAMNLWRPCYAHWAHARPSWRKHLQQLTILLLRNSMLSWKGILIQTDLWDWLM